MIMSQEGFRLLQRECINSGLCYECGLCASVCPAKAIELKMYDWGRNPELTGRCTDEACTRCYDVCAAKLVPVSAMEKRFFGRGRRMDTVEKVGGVCRFVGTGCAVDPEIREIGVSGGVATSLMIFALEKGYVDGCVLAGWDAEKPWLAKAYVATSKKDVIACSGSKYQPHPQLLGIREAYEMGLKKIAVSATPCHAQSLRKMMMNEDFADISGIIRLISCNFCAAHSYETEFMGDGRKLSFPWRYSFSLNEIMYRYIGFGFILPYEATKQSSSINNCSIIPTESCWARS